MLTLGIFMLVALAAFLTGVRRGRRAARRAPPRLVIARRTEQVVYLARR